MEQPLYYVRRGPTLQYGNKVPDDILDMDQVFSLRGEVHDEKLVRLGYVAVVSPRCVIVSCGQCGAKFVSEGALMQHGRRRHDAKRSTEEVVADAVKTSNEQIARDLERERVADVTEAMNAQEDRKLERTERSLDAERPLYWEKTEGARRAGDAPVPEVTMAPVAAAAPEPQKVEAPKPRKRPQVRKETP